MNCGPTYGQPVVVESWESSFVKSELQNDELQSTNPDCHWLADHYVAFFFWLLDWWNHKLENHWMSVAEGEISQSEIGPERPADFYYPKGVSPIKKMMSRFIVHKRIPIHKRGIPIHKRIPYMVHKRLTGMDGFHGDTFSSGFGDFSTAKRGKRLMTGSGFYGGDTFSQGFGDFSTAKRSGTYDFHGDTFSDGFGDFMTV